MLNPYNKTLARLVATISAMTMGLCLFHCGSEAATEEEDEPVGEAAAAVISCVWRGTAPICEGECEAGETEVTRSKTGDGAYCFTGTKALCCR